MLIRKAIQLFNFLVLFEISASVIDCLVEFAMRQVSPLQLAVPRQIWPCPRTHSWHDIKQSNGLAIRFKREFKSLSHLNVQREFQPQCCNAHSVLKMFQTHSHSHIDCWWFCLRSGKIIFKRAVGLSKRWWTRFGTAACFCGCFYRPAMQQLTKLGTGSTDIHSAIPRRPMPWHIRGSIRSFATESFWMFSGTLALTSSGAQGTVQTITYILCLYQSLTWKFGNHHCTPALVGVLGHGWPCLHYPFKLRCLFSGVHSPLVSNSQMRFKKQLKRYKTFPALQWNAAQVCYADSKTTPVSTFFCFPPQRFPGSKGSSGRVPIGIRYVLRCLVEFNFSVSSKIQTRKLKLKECMCKPECRPSWPGMEATCFLWQSGKELRITHSSCACVCYLSHKSRCAVNLKQKLFKQIDTHLQWPLPHWFQFPCWSVGPFQFCLSWLKRPAQVEVSWLRFWSGAKSWPQLPAQGCGAVKPSETVTQGTRCLLTVLTVPDD